MPTKPLSKTTKPVNRMRPIHPGEILREDYLRSMGISANRFAQLLGVPTNRVTQILNERRGITAETALRLARVFDTSPELWMNLQQAFELRTAELELGPELKALKPLAEVG